jgi:N-acyl-D-aspartate/D-glutamate deacylase
VWDVVRVHAVMNPANKALEGKSIVEIAAARGVDPATAAIDLALDDDLATQFVRGSTSPDERTEAYLSSPHAMIGSSDAGAHITTFCGGANTSVFLAKWVRERKLMSLEAAVRRLTSEPAAVLGFRNRGWLREGYAADVVVFDPDTIDCGPARYVDDLPGGGHRVWHDAEGVDHVLVNGRVVVRERELTGAVAGELIPPS